MIDNVKNQDGRPVAIVIGATGGIGGRLAERLAADGYRLALLGRDEEKLKERAADVDATHHVVDATNADAVAEAFGAIKDELGRVDAVANCAGSLLLRPAHRTSMDEWRATMDANLTTAFATVKASVDVLDEGGSVVLVSSVAARTGLSNHEAIAAAKAGVIGLTLSAAATYANRGLRFNAVAPGLVRTPMTASMTKNEKAVEMLEANHPLGRLGEPDDIAAAIAFLLGPDSSWITGQVLSSDGGMSTVTAKPKAPARATSKSS